MKDLPETYVQNMKGLLKDDLQAYLDSFDEERSYGLRVNTGKISVEEFLKIAPFKLKPIPWCRDGFYYSPDDEPSKHPYYYAGLYYLQEPSAMLPAEVLPIEEGDLVLDACSAPGGKAAKLSNKLNNKGLLICNDISVSRCQVLLKTIETHGIVNSIVIAEDLNDLSRFQGFFDKILLDAPCSGEGMFRKESGLINSWLEKGNDYYSDIQKKLIIKALELLREGGMMVYSTCTFSPKEDEEVVEYALDHFTELKVMPVKMHEGFKPGISERTKNCVRLYPHEIKGEGHFVALLQKGDRKDKEKKALPSGRLPDLDLFRNMTIDVSGKQFTERKEKYYLDPLASVDLSGLRIMRSGLYLGEMRHDRFEPSYALAMALRKDGYENTVTFKPDDVRVLKYLRGETLDVKDHDVQGMVLVCIGNFPLGWGIVNKGILKNRYPAGYRYR